MDYNTASNLIYCGDFVENVKNLLFYAHGLPAVVALILGMFVILRDRKSYLAQTLFTINILFVVWCILSLSIWIGYAKNSLIMSSWAPIEMVAISIFLVSIYFINLFIYEKPPSLLKISIITVILAVFAVLAPTKFNLIHFDPIECVSIENHLYLQIIFFTKLILSLWMIFEIIWGIFKNKEKRKQIIILAIGIMFFLLSFYIAGYLSDLTENYKLEIYGLFGMVVFTGVLTYLIVRFKTFNIKMLGAQALVCSLIIIIGAEFFFIQNNVNKILTAITLIIAAIIGLLLIRSVKKVDAQKEELEVANSNQAALMHFITHQLKGFFTRTKSIFAGLMEGDFGQMPEVVTNVAKEGLSSDDKAVAMIQDILSASNFKSGTVAYMFMDIDFSALVRDIASSFKDMMKEKGLVFEVNMPEKPVIISADKTQISQVVKNLIDNSFRYTPTGSIKVSLKNSVDPISGGRASGNNVIFEIVDTGVGLSEVDKKKLFTEGGKGEESLKVNVNSTGYGLYIVKKIVENHKGRVWAESSGRGHGSQFYVSLPVR